MSPTTTTPSPATAKVRGTNHRISVWKLFDTLPPILCRLLARHGPRWPRTDEDIARDSGLAIHEVYLISLQTDWDGVDLRSARAFLRGCHINFDSRNQMQRIRRYLKGKDHNRPPTWQYLRMSPFWKTFYQPLMLRWRDSLIAKQRDKARAPHE